MSIIIQRPWTRQPNIPVRPWRHGLRALLLPVQGTVIDLVTGLVATRNNSASVTPTARGLSAVSNSSSWWSFEDHPSHDVTGPLTAVFVGSTSSLSGPLFNKGDASAGNSGPFALTFSGGTFPLLRRAGATDYQNFVFTTETLVADPLFVAVMQNGVLGSGATARLCVNGTFYSTTGGGMADSVATGSTTGLRIGKSDSDYTNSGFVLFAMLDRFASDAEIISIYRNPWQLFAPLPRRIWAPSAGGAATHTTTGALASGSATVAGTATHKTLHTTSGALAAQASTIAGTAAHQHASTGALAAQSATVAGTAAHKTLHATSGALASQASTIAGTADHAVPGGTHPTDGALASQAATLAGTAAHATLHATTGALAAQAASIAGTAGHAVVHETSGALAADSATISGAAAGPQPNIVQGRPRLPRRTTAEFWRQDDDDTLEAQAIVLPIDLLGQVAMADDDDRLEAAASPVVYRYADGLRRHTPRQQDWLTGRLQ